MAGNGSETSTSSMVTAESMTTEWISTSSLMSSETSPVNATTSAGRQDNVTDLSRTSSVFGFPGPDNVTSPNSSLALNSSQEIDLEALNLAMTKALMPTIIYLAILMLVGAVGNTVVLLVYYRRFKPSATRTYVLSMSVCDLLANIFSLPSEIIDICYSFTFDLPFLCRSIRGFNSFLTLTSAFVLVAVAKDRFNKICRPMDKHRPLKRIKIYVLICALASLSLSVVFFALNGSHTVPTGVGNATGITCSVSDEFLDTMFPLMYNVLMALAFILCVVIMTVCYIRIALELWRHKKKQARVSGAAAITKASAAKGARKAVGPVVEDNSSGPVQHPQHSDPTSSSSAELIPLKSTNTAGKNPKSKTTASPPSTNPVSDKQVLLLSIKNLNYEGPSSSVEDSDEGCFSGCSMETTSTSVDLSKDGHAQNGQETRSDSHPRSFQTQTTDAGGHLNAACPEDHATSDSQPKTTRAPQTNDKQGSDLPDSTSSPHEIQPTNDSPPPPHRNFVDRTSSLLQRLLTPRRRHDDRESAGKPTGGRCQIVKKRGTVKAIPSSTTLMMFVLTATFVVNYLPHLTIISLRAMSDTFGDGLTGAMLNLYNIGLRSYFMNCAVNSLVYGFCSARFRQECRLLFARK